MPGCLSGTSISVLVRSKFLSVAIRASGLCVVGLLYHDVGRCVVILSGCFAYCIAKKPYVL